MLADPGACLKVADLVARTWLSSSSDNYILFPGLAQMFHLVTASFIFLFYLFRKKKKSGKILCDPLPHLADTEEKANETCDQINGSFGHEQDDGCV